MYLTAFATDFTIDLKGNNNRTTRRIYAKLTDFTIDLKGNNNNRIIFDLKGY